MNTLYREFETSDGHAFQAWRNSLKSNVRFHLGQHQDEYSDTLLIKDFF